MLYDPKWEKKTKPKRRRLSTWFWPIQPKEVFDLDDFTAWAALKNPFQKYQYSCPLECALAQYLKERGVTGLRIMILPGGMERLHPHLQGALNCFGGAGYTFGGLRDRLLSIPR